METLMDTARRIQNLTSVLSQPKLLTETGIVPMICFMMTEVKMNKFLKMNSQQWAMESLQTMLTDTRRKRSTTMIAITAELNILFVFFVAITNMKVNIQHVAYHMSHMICDIPYDMSHILSYWYDFLTFFQLIRLKLPNVIPKLVTGFKNKVNVDQNGNQNVIFHQLKRVATGTVLLCSLIQKHQEKLNYLNFMMSLV